MKFIHLSDAHLDSPFLGLSFLPFNQFEAIKNSSKESFERAVDLALEEKVDLFLIAGDTFDSATPSPQIQLFFLKQLNRLVDKKIQVVMILGNHDYLSFEKLLLPNNLYFKLLGKDQTIETFVSQTQMGFSYSVTGFSYQQNHIQEDMVKKFPEKDLTKFNIGLMHGQLKTNRKQADVYAPFTLSEIKNLQYDYFALGHIHKRETLSFEPFVGYSGNIQGRHINERGAKGVSLVTVDDTTKKFDVKFVPTSSLKWQLIEINLLQTYATQDLGELIIQKLNEVILQPSLLGIKLKGSQFLAQETIEFLQDARYLADISGELKFNSHLVKVYLQTNEPIELNKTDQLAFKNAQQEIFTSENIQKLAKPLTSKADWLKKMVQDPRMMENIKDLAQVKLSQKLRNKDE